MISFKLRVGKAQTSQASRGFAVIIPNFFFREMPLNIFIIKKCNKIK